MERTQPSTGDAERGLITRRGGSGAADAALGPKAAFIPAIAAQPALWALGVKKA